MILKEPLTKEILEKRVKTTYQYILDLREKLDETECFGIYVWKVVPRLNGRGVGEIPIFTEMNHTASSCALKCQIIFTCKHFRHNGVTTECALYDGEGYRAVTDVTGNQFYQKMPDDCVAGRDEWFPEWRSCILIKTDWLPYEEAKKKCELEIRTMMGAKNFTQIQNLMDSLGFKWIHVYARRTGTDSYEWFDRTPVTEGWCLAQPDSNTGCVGVDLSKSWCSKGGLDDFPCTDHRQFLCA
ncbi:uncharacterized protein LOC133191571 [Saccostrea echinata]|uniref:uncharacterized protein LOC133191571 n=1 Tax=Saccostrea echinata TaxID=191078 RepID=UPI002A826781|nr:uncharacterized protein LOC133191571 [Saccostrea echinata]